MDTYYVRKIRTLTGDKQIDYTALANLPVSDKTLSEEGGFADAKFTGDELKKKASQKEVTKLKEDISDLKKSAYTDAFFRNFFAMQRTGKKYTVRFPLWETSQVATGEKLDDNTGLIMEASTITEKGRDDYETIPLFRTYDCNVEKIDGKLKITAMKGDIGFNPKEKDTFVLGMPYYHKAWEQAGGHRRKARR